MNLLRTTHHALRTKTYVLRPFTYPPSPWSLKLVACSCGACPAFSLQLAAWSLQLSYPHRSLLVRFLRKSAVCRKRIFRIFRTRPAFGTDKINFHIFCFYVIQPYAFYASYGKYDFHAQLKSYEATSAQLSPVFRLHYKLLPGSVALFLWLINLKMSGYRKFYVFHATRRKDREYLPVLSCNPSIQKCTL